MRALNKYLQLSSDSTGRFRQDEIVLNCFFSTIDEIESELEIVLLARQFVCDQKLVLPVELPFDARSPLRLVEASLRGAIHDNAKIETHDERYQLVALGNENALDHVVLEYGHQNWDQVDASLQYVLLKLTAIKYDDRVDSSERPADVLRILESYRNFHLWRRH